MTVARTFFIIAFLSYWLMGSALRLQLDHSRFPIEPADHPDPRPPGVMQEQCQEAEWT